MIDLIGAIAVTFIYATLVGVLIGLAPLGGRERLAAFAAAAGWGGLVVAVAALGGFAPGATGRLPAPAIPFAGFLALLFGAWFLLPRFRDALLAVPTAALIAVNAGRVGGIFFLILFAQGRLSAPFAPVAGAGDILVGVLAIPLAFAASGRAELRPVGLGLWNALGALDLVVAISLGLLSAPGTPFRVFTEEPGTLAMTTLPWIMVAAMLVPLYLLVHFAIAAQRGLSRSPGAAAAVAG